MKRVVIGVLFLGLSAGLAGAQSLAEVARKEKKRRTQSTGPVIVVSEHTLRGYRAEEPLPAAERGATAAKPTEEEAAEAADTPPAAVPTPSDVARERAELRASRVACSERLHRAQRELREQQALLRQGVTLWGEAPTSYGGYIVMDGARGSQEVLGAVPGYYRYQQGHLTCVMATRNRSRYPDEAAECDAIEARIDALRAEIGAGCDAGR